MADTDVRLEEDVVEIVGPLKIVDGDDTVEIDSRGIIWESGADVDTFQYGRNYGVIPGSSDFEARFISAEGVTAEELQSETLSVIRAQFGGEPPGSEVPQGGRIEVLDTNGDVAVSVDGKQGVVESVNGDFAEYFPNGAGSSFEGGAVVGLDGGAVTDSVMDCDEAFVVTSDPMVLGNCPADPTDEQHVPLALLGQVPVRVAAAVEAGDRLVATDDCRAVPVGDGDADAPFVGRALESAAASDETVTVLVGSTSAAGAHRQARATTPTDDGQSTTDPDREGQAADRIAELEAENRALRERLSEVEARLSAVEGGSSAASQPADD